MQIMKYPYVALVLIIIWVGTMIMILKGSGLNVSYALLTALVGTAVISFFGFRPPRLGR